MLTKWQKRRNILRTGTRLIVSSILPWNVWTEKWVFLPEHRWYRRFVAQWEMAWMFLCISVKAWRDA